MTLQLLYFRGTFFLYFMVFNFYSQKYKPIIFQMYVPLQKKLIEKINNSLLACCFLKNIIPHVYIAGVNNL